ncbi:MAG: hypothetical protein RKE49_03315 [Oceanicaulis sp.]
MSYFRPSNGAEASDRLAMLTAFAAGFAALVHSLNIWQAYVNADLAAALEMIQLVGGAAVLMIFLPLFIWFKLRRGAPAMNPWKDDGYLGAVVKRAGFTAFAGLLVAALALSTLSKRLLPLISGEIMLDIVISAALALFSLSFFIFSSGPDGDPFEDEA